LKKLPEPCACGQMSPEKVEESPQVVIWSDAKNDSESICFHEEGRDNAVIGSF
jgi:hypothetical protein